MDRLVLVAAAVILGVYSYSLWNKNNQLQADIDEEIKKAEISIDSTMLSEATEFTFMKVTNQFTYYMSEKDVGPKKGKWEALYTWDYPFNFGFKIDNDWKWCIKINEAEGIVTLNAPKVMQLNKSDASPNAVKIFNGRIKSTQTAAQEWMINVANKKMTDAADAYLTNNTVQDSVKKTLASFFQDILNDAHEHSNPVSKVIVNTVPESTCNE